MSITELPRGGGIASKDSTLLADMAATSLAAILYNGDTTLTFTSGSVRLTQKQIETLKDEGVNIGESR